MHISCGIIKINLGEWAIASHGKDTRPLMEVANVDSNYLSQHQQLQDGCDPHIKEKCLSVTGTSACAIAKQAQTTTEFFASSSVAMVMTNVFF